MKVERWNGLENSWRIFAVIAVSVLISVVWDGVTWPDKNLTKQQSLLRHTEEKKSSYISQNMTPQNRSQVPEPSSLILFGSGLLTMVIAFLRRTYNIAKRAVDIAASALALTVLLPLCLLAALLIKITSKGPIFYSQVRSGKEGKHFDIYKFRTMKLDAEKESGPVWARLKDDRITPIGRFLRKSHIDEIPQFINVLHGDMSVIGPRPERPIFIEKLKSQISDYPKRLSVKPGITGLAQVYHRYDESLSDVRKKVKYDLLYIKRMSMGTDLRIAARTMSVITGFGPH
jgi:lipopolysaccharide/colanic/teichoic acid biosynthesis glycosyltransferase